MRKIYSYIEDGELKLSKLETYLEITKYLIEIYNKTKDTDTSNPLAKILLSKRKDQIDYLTKHELI